MNLDGSESGNITLLLLDHSTAWYSVYSTAWYSVYSTAWYSVHSTAWCSVYSTAWYSVYRLIGFLVFVIIFSFLSTLDLIQKRSKNASNIYDRELCNSG